MSEAAHTLLYMDTPQSSLVTYPPRSGIRMYSSPRLEIMCSTSIRIYTGLD
jgi:hypothetical protein